ncbi:hypothetical protein ACFC1T_05880 [Kitasatospora sp. NPDC056076]|uniref:hypothetical protein n=1 Tax=Kitasatospora sp. NPDC056076 TaxID=3345703 RepID=UPI0035DE0E08
MADKTWEDVLPVFASSTQTTFVQRSTVTGDDKVKWIANHKCETLNYFKQTGGNEGYDCWWSYNFTGTDGGQWSYVIGCNLNWPQFEAGTTDLGKWIQQGYDVLMPLAHSPAENDTMSVWSFDTAAATLQGAEQLLQTWAPTVNGWAGDIAAPGADWQGSAAGAFRTMLTMFGGELDDLAKDLHDKHVYSYLKDARDAVGNAVLSMWYGQDDYRNSRDAWPVNPLFDSLIEGMSSAHVTVAETSVTNSTSDGPTITVYGTPNFTVTTAWGDPNGDDFWKKAEQRAKEIWLKNVADHLDKAAKEATATLDKAYVPAIKALSAGVKTPSMRTPYNPPPTDDPSKTDPLADLGKNLSTMNDNMNKSLSDMSKGMSDNFKSLTGGPGGLGGPDGLKGPGSTDLGPGPGLTTGPGRLGGLGDHGGLPSLGDGGGSGVPLLDKNGKQIYGADGNPVTVPPGSRIDPTTHQVIGPDGRPVLGRDGKPITAPDGASVGTGSGDHMKVPPGSTVDDQGRVIGPDGKPVLDGNGNPVVVRPGSRVDSDGTLLDPDGRPVSEVSQLLADQRHAFDSGFGGGFGSGGGGGDGLLPGSDFGSGGYHPSGLSFGDSAGGLGGLGGGLPGGGLLPGGRSGMSAKSLASGGDPNTLQARTAAEAAAEAEKAAAAKAAAEAERAALTGKGMSTTGGMPPMMPPGAGAGAGAPGQKEKDRQRTTWLAEDEEVWGTESTAVSGVIGR